MYSRTAAAVACALLPQLSSGQASGASRVAVPDTPHLSRVEITGDTVRWSSRFDPFAAYRFDRRTRAFSRGPLPTDDIGRNPGSVVPWADDRVHVVDSAYLETVRLDDGRPSWVMRVGNTIIPLRGPRVAAERAWRAAHGLRPTPARRSLDEVEPYQPVPSNDWAPVEVHAFHVDSQAIWLGTATGDPQEYGEFALGGLLRVDRLTRAVAVITDSLLMHATVIQIVRTSPRQMILLTRPTDSTKTSGLFSFDLASRQVRSLTLPGGFVAEHIAIAGDTIFAALGESFAVIERSTGRATVRSQRLDVVGDSVIFSPAESLVEPSWDFLGAVAMAKSLGVKVGEFVTAARGALKAVGLVYGAPGDRTTVTTRIEGSDTDADSALMYYSEVTGPHEIELEGLDHPRLRPLLRDVLRAGNLYWATQIARIILATNDTASIPDLKVALARSTDWSAALLAASLAQLGDSTGRAWIRRALADTTRADPSGARPIHHFVFEAAGDAKDPDNVPRLMALLRDPAYSVSASRSLAAYNNAETWYHLLGALRQNVSPAATRQLLFHIRDDSSATLRSPLVHEQLRALAREALVGADTSSRDVAAEVIAVHGTVADIPILIAQLGAGEQAYRRAVLALVRLAGSGDEAMPRGSGTAAERLAAQTWWSAWFERSRTTFRAASRDAGGSAWMRMLDRLRREPPSPR